MVDSSQRCDTMPTRTCLATYAATDVLDMSARLLMSCECRSHTSDTYQMTGRHGVAPTQLDELVSRTTHVRRVIRVPKHLAQCLS